MTANLKKLFNKFDLIFKLIDTVGLILASMCAFILMIFVVTEVLGRDIFNMEIIPGNIEISQSVLMPGIVFLGAAYAYRCGVFPRVELIQSRVSPLIQRILIIVSLIILLIGLGFLITFGWKYIFIVATNDIKFQAGTKLITMLPVVVLVPLGAISIALRAILNLWQAIDLKMGLKPEMEKRDSYLLE